MTASQGMIDPAVFTHLQNKLDEDVQVREEIRNILQSMERRDRVTTSILSRAHSIHENDLAKTLDEALDSINEQIGNVVKLGEIASKHPYYKYNGMWSREMQNACFAIIFWGWLSSRTKGSTGQLFKIEEVGNLLRIPVSLKEQDRFHLTIEEYLHSLVSLIEELARLAVNSVTLGDYKRPLEISQFVKDLHAGFQILNLKNDSLRRRNDSIKYNVKKIEDVVYDLSLRNLVPKGTTSA
ncbi:Translin-1 [Lecanora helva]